MKERITGLDRLDGRACAPIGVKGCAAVKGVWTVTIRDPQGNVIREDTWENLVTDAGLNELLSATLAAGTQTTTWYIGLTDGTPTAAAGDTMASHAGWTEVTGYDEAARQTWTAGSVASKSVDNSASKATFTITSDSTTVGGAFLGSNNTKSGTTGTLYSIGAFSGGDVTLSAGSTLQVTATFTTAAA